MLARSTPNLAVTPDSQVTTEDKQQQQPLQTIANGSDLRKSRCRSESPASVGPGASRITESPGTSRRIVIRAVKSPSPAPQSSDCKDPDQVLTGKSQKVSLMIRTELTSFSCM